MPTRLNFRGVELNLTNRQEVLAAIDAATADQKVRIATANPEFIELAVRNTPFHEALSQMSYVTVDGSGLLFFLNFWRRLRKQPFVPDLYHGSDMVNELFARYSKGEKRFFLLGGTEGLMEQAAAKIRERYPRICIVGTESGGEINTTHIQLSPPLLQQLQVAKPDILFVGFGAPKQELWIQAASHLEIPVMAGVGGSLDFYVTKKRAPQIFRSLHLEWLYRSFTEKGHFKRAYRATLVFSLTSLWWILTKGSDRAH